jgi:hypothetical protein
VHEAESVDSDWTDPTLQAELMHSWEQTHPVHNENKPSYLPAEMVSEYQKRPLPTTPHPMGIAEVGQALSEEASSAGVPGPASQAAEETARLAVERAETERAEAQRVEEARLQAERDIVRQRIQERNAQLTRSVESALEQLGPDPAVLERARKEEEMELAFREAAVTDDGSEISEYEEELVRC